MLPVYYAMKRNGTLEESIREILSGYYIIKLKFFDRSCYAVVSDRGFVLALQVRYRLEGDTISFKVFSEFDSSMGFDFPISWLPLLTPNDSPISVAWREKIKKGNNFTVKNSKGEVVAVFKTRDTKKAFRRFMELRVVGPLTMTSEWHTIQWTRDS